MEEMRRRQADWQFITYSNAKHGFTEPRKILSVSLINLLIPDLINSTYVGIGYDEKAARRSWDAMLNFFKDI